MKRIIPSYKFVLSCLTVVLLPLVAAHAFLPLPPGPVTPTIDPPGDATLGIEGAVKKTKAMIDEGQRIQSETLEKIKSGEFIPFKLDISFFHKEKDEPNIAVAKTISPSTVADIKDEASIVEAFHKLFLTYPQDVIDLFPNNPNAVKKAYRDKAVEFSNDSMLEMYIVVRDLEEHMAALKKEYDTLTSCYVKGNSESSTACESASGTDEELGIWTNYYKLNVIYDSLLKIAEELTAIKAQYEVAQSLRKGIEPTEEEKASEEKVSFNFKQVMPLAYAQLSERREAVRSENSQDSEPFKLRKNTFQPNSNLVPAAAKPYKLESPFAGTDDQFQSLALTNNAYQQLKLAIDVHNLKRQLREYRKVFVEVSQMRQLHEKAVEKLLDSEKCIISYLGNYYGSPENVWLGSGCSYSGNKIVCNSGITVTPDNLKNMKQGSMLCPGDKNKICQSAGVSEYAARGGFSGWLVSAWKTAKAQTVLALNEDNLAQTVLSNDLGGENLADMQAGQDVFVSEIEAGVSDSPYLKPSDAPKIEAENREQELLAWQIGAEGAKALGKDMISNSPVWGKVKAAYPLWNDEKYFYDQYLAEKYDNMKSYIRSLDMRRQAVKLAIDITDALSGSDKLNGVSLADVKSYNNTVLQEALNLLDKEDTPVPVENAVSKAQKEADAALAKLTGNFNARRVSLDNTKSSVYQNLDTQNLALNEFKKAQNDANQEIKSANADTQMQDMLVDIARQRAEKSADSMSNFKSDAEKAKDENEQHIETSESAAAAAEVQVDAKRDIIDELNLRLQQAEDDLTRAKSDFAANASAQEAAGLADVKQAAELSAAENKALALKNSEYLAKVLRRHSSGGLLDAAKRQALMSIVNLADDLIAGAKEKAIAKIDDGYNQIQKLDERKYADHGQVLKIHRQIIENLKKPVAGVRITDLSLIGLLNAGKVRAIANNIFNELVVSSLCAENSCYQADGRYFVGLPAKEADFQAPKAVVTTYTPPLREIVHFDSVDYDNVVKSDQLKTTRAAFLDYGREIPQIWQQMLGNKGFVEKDVDIEAILAHNDNADDVLLRGGTYPCLAGNYDVDFLNGSFYIYPTTRKTKICRDVKAVKIYAGAMAQVVVNGETIRAKYGSALPKRNPSELSLLLSYNNGLGFNAKLNDIMDYFEKLEGSNDSEPDAYGNIYEKALLRRNQFGDFLKFVEVESVYQAAIDKLEVKVGEMRQKLQTEFDKIDYKPAEDFDLADDKTYDEISSVLDEAKNKKLQEAIATAAQIQPSNDVLKDKLTRINNVISALQLDNDEVVHLSDNMAGDSELSEKIKRAGTDREVMNKYEEEARQEFEKNMNSFDEPYCAVYDL